MSVGSPAGLAYGDGSVWAVDSADRIVSRIDPATHAVVQQIPVGADPAAVTVTGARRVGHQQRRRDGVTDQHRDQQGRRDDPGRQPPGRHRGGPGGVWVANQGDGTVDRIDAVTGEVTKRGIPVGGAPGRDRGRPRRRLGRQRRGRHGARIDPATGQPSGPVPVGSGPEGIAVTPGAVWVANSLDLTVSKLDPATGTVTATVSVGDGPSGIVAAGDGVWVSNEFERHARPHRPCSDRVVRGSPGKLAAGHGGGRVRRMGRRAAVPVRPATAAAR